MKSIQLIALSAVSLCFAHPARAGIERYKDEALYLARLAELGYTAQAENFDGPDWEGVRSNFPLNNYAASVTSKRARWASAGRDLWTWPGTAALITTNLNWGRNGTWGVYDNYLASTLRITVPEPIYGVGLWVNTNPDGQDVGFLFEDRTTATDPGYMVGGYGAMYPGDIHPFGHGFVGLIDTSGFTDVIVTGTLEVNEEGQLEGGTVHGVDDVTFAVPAGFFTPPLEEWRGNHFPAGDLADSTKEASVWGHWADPDRNGLRNIVEYLLGSDPNDPQDGPGKITTAIANEGGTRVIRMTVAVRTDDPALEATVETATDLGQWSENGVTMESPVPAGEGFELRTYRAEAPSGADIFHSRLKVSWTE